MFKSKVQPLIIPQYEHGRMAGILAAHWGNDWFDKPAMDFALWVAGVAFHDWNYGLLDNLPIGEASEEEWLAMARRGVSVELDDPITDTVAKLHIRRLLSGQETGERAAMIRQIDAHIDKRLAATGHPLCDFLWADRITRLCDNIAFDFAFGQARADQAGVYARRDSTQETAISYRIQTGGQILLQPWPFAAASISGVITGFAADGYPDRLQPRLLPFSLAPQLQSDP